MKKISVCSYIVSVLLTCAAAGSPAWTASGGEGRKSPGADVLSQPGPTFTVPDSQLPKKLSIIVYGDMRFTDPSNTKVANPRARQLLVDKVVSEHPDALELTGDIAYAGKNPADYEEFKAETASWRAANLRVYPALGNHELVGGPDSLKNWWAAFPELSNRRWYSVELGKRVYLINRCKSTVLSRGLRPARPAFFRAARPSCSTCLDQRCTVCRCTPRTRAISA